MKFYYFLLLIVLFQISLAQEEGWAGKVFYQKYGSKLQEYKLEEFSMVENIVKFASHEFNLKDLQYECYTKGDGYPCGFNEFMTQRGQKYAAFKADTDNFLKRIQGDSCLVLEFNEKKTIFPWYICTENAGDLVQLQQSIKLNYEEYVQKMPLEQLPDDVKVNQEFALETFIEDKGEVKQETGSFYVQKNQLENSQFAPIVEYAKIDPIDNYKCGVELDLEELPEAATKLKIQPSCCMQFDVSALKHVYCSINKPFCTLEIRRLARYMKISCLLHFHNQKFDPTQAPDEATLKEFDGGEAGKGKWEGWGYYWSVTSTLFHSEKPYFIKIHDDKETLNLSVNPEADPQAKIKLSKLQYNYEPNKVVKLKEFEEKEGSDEAVIKALDGIDAMLLKTGGDEATLKDNCFVLETENRDVICLKEETAATSFEKALVAAHASAEASGSINDAEPISVDSKFKGVVFIMKEKKFEGEVKVDENELTFVDSSPALVMKYQDIDTIDGDVCAIKLKDFTLEPTVFETETAITSTCCLEILTKQQQSITICIDKTENDCEGQLLKVASRVRKNCMGNTITKSQMADYEKDTDDQNKNGIWRGWVYYAEIQGTSTVPADKPRFLDIDAVHEEINLFESPGSKQLWQGDLFDVKVSCEKQEEPCDIAQYSQAIKDPEFEKTIGEAAHSMGVSDPQKCFVLEFRQHKVKTHLVCAIDVNQHENVVNALAVASQKVTEETDIDNLPIADKEDEVSMAVWAKASGVKQYKAKLGNEALKDASSEAEIVKYSDIGTQYGFKCGLEFRNVEVNEALKSIQPNPQACFTGVISSLRYEFCVEDPIRPVLKARKFMKKMHALCIEQAVEAGEVNEALLKTQVVEEHDVVTGGASDTPENPNAGPDGELESDPENGAWKGNVYYMKLGESVTMSTPLKGLFELKDDKISFKGEDGTSYDYSVLELYFTCKSVGPCLAEKYIKNQSNNLSPLLFHQLTKSIQKFIQASQVTVMDSCTVISNLDPYVGFRNDAIVCTKQSDQGNNFRRAVEVAFDKEAELVQPTDESWNKNIPKLYIDNSFDTYVIAPKVGDQALRTLHFDSYKIFKQHVLDVQVKYSEIDYDEANKSCKINIIPDAIDRIAEIEGLELAEKSCCWSYYSKQLENIICQQGTIRCQIDKKQQLKHAIYYCNQGHLNDGNDNSAELQVEETFDFGFDRYDILHKLDSKTKLPADHENIDELIKQSMNDPVNGVFQGYVYHQSMTLRDQSKKVTMMFLSVDQDSVRFYRNATDEVAIHEFEVNRLSFPCLDKQYVSNPTEYAECVSSKIRFVAKQRLLSSILSYTSQTPFNDPKQCIIIDIQEPHVRAVQSEFICTLSLPDIQQLKEALSNSNYMSLESSNVEYDIPLVMSENEHFAVKTFEEGDVQEFNAAFHEDGMVQYVGKNKPHKSRFAYSQVAADSLGDTCAAWYQNIVIPKELDVDDPNCCFVFKKSPDSMITVCSTNTYKCLYEARMMLKAFHHGCKDFFAKNDVDLVAPPLPSKPAQIVENNLDVVELDVNNGAYKGSIWVFKMLQDLPMSESPWYVEVNARDQVIDVFPSPETHHPMTGEKNPTVMQFSLLNMLWPCGKFTPCKKKDILEYLNQEEQDSNRIDTFKYELDQIKETMRSDDALDTCVFVEFKHEAGPEIIALCSTDTSLVNQFQNTLGQAYDVSALMADINQQIGFASTEDKFKISYYDGSIKKMTVQLGKLALQDDTNNNKVFDYVDIQDDKYGTPCAFWYKFLTLPDEFEGYEKQCCFAFVAEKTDKYICMQHHTHCQIDALVLLKSLREGCLSGEKGADLATGPSVNGDASRIEGTEVTGETAIKGLKMHDQDNSEKQIWNITNLSLKMDEEKAAQEAGFAHATAENYNFDPLAFTWEGWMLVGELPLDAETLKTPEVEFVKITAEKASRLTAPDDKAVEIESSPNQFLKMGCAGGMCIPSQFLTQLKEGPIMDEPAEFRFAETKSKASYKVDETEKQINDMVARIGDELFCRVMEHVIDGSPRGRNYCVVMGDQTMINSFAGNLMEISSKIGEVIPISAAPLMGDGQEMTVEYFTTGQPQSDIKTVVFTEDAMNTVDGESVLKYSDVEKCWLCYHLVEPVNEIKAESQCCAKFSILGAENILCSNDPSEQCSGPLKQMLKKIYTQCKASAEEGAEETQEPMTCGTDAEYKEQAEKVAEKLQENNPEATDEEAQKLLEDLLANMPVSGADQTAAEIATISSIISSLTTVTIVSTVTTVNGLLITFSDGSTSLQKADGSTVITYNDGTTIIINVNNTVTIMNNSSVSTLNQDSSMTSVNTATNTASTVSNTGNISSSTVVDNSIVNTAISNTGQTTSSVNTDQSAVNNLNTMMSTASTAISESNTNNVSSKMDTLNQQMNTAAAVMNIENNVAQEVNQNSASSQSIAQTATEQNANVNTNMATATNSATATATNSAKSTTNNKATSTNSASAKSTTANAKSTAKAAQAAGGTANASSASSSSSSSTVNKNVSKSIQNQVNAAKQANFNKHIANTQNSNSISSKSIVNKNVINKAVQKNVVNNVNNVSTSSSSTTNIVNGKKVEGQPRQSVPGVGEVDPDVHVTTVIEAPNATRNSKQPKNDKGESKVDSLNWEVNIIKVTKKLNDDMSCEGPVAPEDRR